jgi:hypothetical protein
MALAFEDLPISIGRVYKKPKTRERTGWVVREVMGAGGKNDPSIVCTYE